jgi:hypothetical protein
MITLIDLALDIYPLITLAHSNSEEEMQGAEVDISRAVFGTCLYMVIYHVGEIGEIGVELSTSVIYTMHCSYTSFLSDYVITTYASQELV